MPLVSQNKRQTSRLFLGTVLIAALLRLGLFAYTYTWPIKAYANSDAFNYVHIALNLVAHGVFSNSIEAPYIPDIYRTPVYPVFLAGLYGLGGGAFTLVMLLQALLGALSAGLTLLLARELNLSITVGFIAAMLISLEPLNILFTNLLMTETLFNLFLLAGLLFFVRFFNSRNSSWLIAAAAAFALAALTRPILQYLPFFLAPLFLIFTRGTERLRFMRLGLLFAMLAFAFTNVWAYRNYRAMGSWSISEKDDYNLVYWRAKFVLAEATGMDPDVTEDYLDEEINARLGDMPRSPLDSLLAGRQVALDIFRRYPVDTAKVHLDGLARLYFSPGFDNICAQLSRSAEIEGCKTHDPDSKLQGIWGRVQKKVGMMDGFQLMIALVQVSILLLTYLGAALGGVELFHRKQWFVILLLCIVIAYLSLLSTGGESTSRFRIPLMPLFAILAGVGFERVFANLPRLRRALAHHDPSEATLVSPDL